MHGGGHVIGTGKDATNMFSSSVGSLGCDWLEKQKHNVAWYHPAANQLYDCAWGTCTKQRWHGLPAGHWGSPYRIYKEGGAVGDVIALDSAIYFDRMFHGVFNPTKSIAIGKSTAIAGVSMASKTIFVLKAQDARSAAVARAAKVVEERAKATQRAAEQRTKAAKVVEERTKARIRSPPTRVLCTMFYFSRMSSTTTLTKTKETTPL